MTVRESVNLAEAEIREVFEKEGSVDHLSSTTGFFRDIVGQCPICGREVIRMKSFYGCTGYKDGCKFSVNTSICGKVISLSILNQLLEHKKTDVLDGFVSPKSGKSFSAALKLENARAVFDFSQVPRQASATASHRYSSIDTGEEPPLPEPPPGY